MGYDGSILYLHSVSGLFCRLVLNKIFLENWSVPVLRWTGLEVTILLGPKDRAVLSYR